MYIVWKYSLARVVSVLETKHRTIVSNILFDDSVGEDISLRDHITGSMFISCGNIIRNNERLYWDCFPILGCLIWNKNNTFVLEYSVENSFIVAIFHLQTCLTSEISRHKTMNVFATDCSLCFYRDTLLISQMSGVSELSRHNNTEWTLIDQILTYDIRFFDILTVSFWNFDIWH